MTHRMARLKAHPFAYSPSPCSLTPSINVCMHRQGSRATAADPMHALREIGGNH